MLIQCSCTENKIALQARIGQLSQNKGKCVNRLASDQGILVLGMYYTMLKEYEISYDSLNAG
jgi:hypothetical protein